ncbi:DUF2793 domain-containing protein [Sphingomonas rubra]|uniref:DUF2793 domain-containing protein n=1 Tax=Sphingomonas rubra TaxID=634430 RepID=A0A1I5TIK5_9SPHN|nr:DUF2793 domain-containing protein [Sphingomonas rubra]SFP82892.1 Protein of unknown function [Sphingomonas rubra]
MTIRTARLALDLLEPGQSQKELHHNEALALLDLGVQASVIAAGTDVPPQMPEPGQCWIVGTVPTGAWTGRPQAIAGWTAAGWRFVAPREGLVAWDEGRHVCQRFSAGRWQAGVVRGTELDIAGERVVGPRAGAIAAPAGGGTVDAEARATLAALLAALRGHGLIAF